MISFNQHISPADHLSWQPQHGNLIFWGNFDHQSYVHHNWLFLPLTDWGCVWQCCRKNSYRDRQNENHGILGNMGNSGQKPKSKPGCCCSFLHSIAETVDSQMGNKLYNGMSPQTLSSILKIWYCLSLGCMSTSCQINCCTSLTLQLAIHLSHVLQQVLAPSLPPNHPTAGEYWGCGCYGYCSNLSVSFIHPIYTGNTCKRFAYVSLLHPFLFSKIKTCATYLFLNIFLNNCRGCHYTQTTWPMKHTSVRCTVPVKCFHPLGCFPLINF